MTSIYFFLFHTPLPSRLGDSLDDPGMPDSRPTGKPDSQPHYYFRGIHRCDAEVPIHQESSLTIISHCMGGLLLLFHTESLLPVLGMHGVRYHLILSKPESTVELFYMNLFNKFPLIRRMSKILQKRTFYIPRPGGQKYAASSPGWSFCRVMRRVVFSPGSSHPL